jgi:phosphoglycolate phosphatase-like HAD superfamily hydrolase
MSAPLALPPAASLRAVLFDIDGTLTDSDPLHFEVFKALFKEVGVPSVGINQGDEIDMHFFHKHISGRWESALARNQSGHVSFIRGVGTGAINYHATANSTHTARHRSHWRCADNTLHELC